MAAIALTIAGSDSGGGAGIQADLKAFSALGVYGASVITAVTAQNTRSVTAVYPIPEDVISAQIAAVLEDLKVDVVKVGMLATPSIIEAVAQGLEGFGGPVVLDPVMVAKSGDALLAADAVEHLRRVLVPRAALLTPNLPEAARLLGSDAADPAADPDTDPATDPAAEFAADFAAADPAGMAAQGRALCELGAGAVLMKGGHGTGEMCHDLLVDRSGVVAELSARRHATRNTHGTGCTLSSAIAAGLARGLGLDMAVRQAHVYLQGAIAAADRLDIGQGHGPVHHFHQSWPR